MEKQSGVDARNKILADIYLNSKYTFEQLHELTQGISLGLDVSVYADPKLSFREMEKVKDELIDQKFVSDLDLDVNLKFSHEQKTLLLYGFERGVDYKVYANPEIPADIMRGIEIELELKDMEVML